MRIEKTTPMNDRIDTSFSEWLINMEKERIQGETDLSRMGNRQIVETDHEDLPEGPEVVLELDESGFFNPF